jgi:basic membrane protein A
VGTTGGPERKRSGPPRVLVAAVAATVLLAGGLVWLIGAGADDTPVPRPTSTIGQGVKICVVAGTPTADGSRFRVPLGRALHGAHRRLAITGSLVAAHGDGVAAAIEHDVNRGCNLIVTSGEEAPRATLDAAKAHPGQHFALLGGSIDETLPNLAWVRFHPEQAAYLAGYLAAGATQTGIVGAFGSVPSHDVTKILDAYAAGIRKFKKDRGVIVPLIGWNPETGEGLFVGNADDQAAGRRAAQTLVADGADVILAVAGDAARGAAGVAHGVGDAYVIGSGWDWAQRAAVQRQWLTTIQQRSALMLRRLIGREVRHEFRPGVVEATLANRGVGLAKLRGPGQALSANLRSTLAELSEQISAGTVSTDVHDYRPPPPDAKPGSPGGGGETE